MAQTARSLPTTGSSKTSPSDGRAGSSSSRLIVGGSRPPSEFERWHVLDHSTEIAQRWTARYERRKGSEADRLDPQRRLEVRHDHTDVVLRLVHRDHGLGEPGETPDRR